jgi:hypothetical protein
MRRRTRLFRMAEFREKQAAVEFNEGGQPSRPQGRLRIDEGPQFHVLFRGEVHVVRLMEDPVEGKALPTEEADEDAIDFVEETILAQVAVGGLVVGDEVPVHQVADQQHEGDRKPQPAVGDAEGQQGLA